MKDSLKEALNQFLDLELIEKDRENICNYKGYQILYRIHQARDFRGIGSYETKLQKPIEMIDKIIKIYSDNHALYCEPIYARRIHEIYRDLNGRKFYSKQWKRTETALKDYVRRIISKSINKEIVSLEKEPTLEGEALSFQVWRNFIRSTPVVSYDDVPSIFLAVYNSMDKKDFDALYMQNFDRESETPDKDKIASIVDRFLLEPCRYYVEDLKMLLIPAHFDTKICIRINLPHYYQEHTLLSAYFETCQVILEQGEKFWVKNFINYMKKHF